ncbi:MAG TPA: hypothetical protein VK812_10730 [Candidatus Binatus sp.]|jgi:hypothetical protein|nr:hypothetical protein [Candidatus Binatus sp.]
MSRTGQVILCCLLVLTLERGISRAQQAAEIVPPTPIPSQILAGKRLFIANAGIDSYYLAGYIASHTGAPNGLYDQFYAAVNSWRRYELVSSPSDSDIVFEISLNREVEYSDPQFRLRILDPKTNVVLWTFVEQVGAGSGRDASRRKAWDGALTRLVNNARVLVNQTTPPSGASNK